MPPPICPRPNDVAQASFPFNTGPSSVSGHLVVVRCWEYMRAPRGRDDPLGQGTRGSATKLKSQVLGIRGVVEAPLSHPHDQ